MDKRAREDLDRCMARLADGDRGAFDPVFARALPIVRRFVSGALHNAADADDVAQAALLKVFASAHRYDPARDALSWILGIAAFEVKTQRKKISRRREVGDRSLETFCDAQQIEDETIARDLLRALNELLGAMSPQDEETILAAADLLPRPPAITPAAFRKRLERALGRLRHAWRERHGVE